MDVKITIAIVMAVSSLIISVLTAMVSNRNALRTGKELEQYKADQSKKAVTQSLVDEEFKKAVEAIEKSATCIQLVKQKIQSVLNSLGGSGSSKEAIANIQSALDNLERCYADIHATMTACEREEFHSAKSLTIQASSLIRTVLIEKQHAEIVDSGDRETLTDLRNRLSDHQYRLLESRNIRLFQRTFPSFRI